MFAAKPTSLPRVAEWAAFLSITAATSQAASRLWPRGRGRCGAGRRPAGLGCTQPVASTSETRRHLGFKSYVPSTASVTLTPSCVRALHDATSCSCLSLRQANFKKEGREKGKMEGRMEGRTGGRSLDRTSSREKLGRATAWNPGLSPTAQRPGQAHGDGKGTGRGQGPGGASRRQRGSGPDSCQKPAPSLR